MRLSRVHPVAAIAALLASLACALAPREADAALITYDISVNGQPGEHQDCDLPDRDCIPALGFLTVDDATRALSGFSLTDGAITWTQSDLTAPPALHFNAAGALTGFSLRATDLDAGHDTLELSSHSLEIERENDQGYSCQGCVRFHAETAPTPLPAGAWLLLSGLGALALCGRRGYAR